MFTLRSTLAQDSEQLLFPPQIAVNYRKADISQRVRVMLDFAMKVSQSAYAVDEDDFHILGEQGFTQDDCWDIAAIAAFFGMSNRLANVTNMRPNTEFYTLGR